MGSRPLGRAGEGLSEDRGGPSPKQLFLYRRQPDFFYRQRRIFFTVVTAGVMHRMTVGMAVTTRRKTCFPTVGTTGTTKAKPPAVTTAFCVYFIPMWR